MQILVTASGLEVLDSAMTECLENRGDFVPHPAFDAWEIARDALS
jgi:hypothetical protein